MSRPPGQNPPEAHSQPSRGSAVLRRGISFATGILCSVFLSAGSSDAAIVATILDPPPLAGYTSFEPEGYRITPVDFNGDTLPECWFYGDSTGLALILAVSHRVFIKLSPPPNIGGLVGNLDGGISLSLGSTVPAGHGWSIGETTRQSELEALGLPLDSTIATMGGGIQAQPWLRASGYVGLELHFADGVHYAWIHIDNDPVVVGYGGFLDAWAYESEQMQPIATGNVPEPSAGILIAIASALMTARAGRKPFQ